MYNALIKISMLNLLYYWHLYLNFIFWENISLHIHLNLYLWHKWQNCLTGKNLNTTLLKADHSFATTVPHSPWCVLFLDYNVIVLYFHIIQVPLECKFNTAQWQKMVHSWTWHISATETKVGPFSSEATYM